MDLQKNKATKLLILGILIELVYILLLFVEPVRKYLGDRDLTLGEPRIWLAVISLLLINVLFYIIASRNIDKGKKTRKIIIVFFIVFSLTLLVAWPISSIDVFSYVGWGRVASEHGANPYLVSYDSLPKDALYDDINNKWLSRPTPYGPLAVIIGSILAFVGSNNLIASLFSFKLFFTLINFLNLYIVWLTFKTNRAIFLYSWCPLFLFEFCLNGHNDVLTIFFLLLALYFFIRAKKTTHYLNVWTMLLLSVLIKYSTVFVLPVFFLVALYNIKNNKDRLIFLALAPLFSIILLLIFFIPFFSGSGSVFSALKSYLFLPHSGGVKLAGLPPIAINSIIFIHNKIDLQIVPWLYVVFRIVFIGIYGGLLLYLFKNRRKIIKNDFIKYSAIVLFLFLALFSGWIYPWYFSTLIIFLIYYSLFNENKYSHLLFGAIFYSIFIYVVIR